jgi:signal transduction histidine kinase
MSVMAAFLGGALPIELYYFPGRLIPYLTVYALELVISATAYIAAWYWQSHARAIATAWAALLGLCIAAYYPLVNGDATLAMAAIICLVSAVPATLPFAARHQIVFGSVCAAGYFGILAWGVPVSLPWLYVFVAFVFVMTLSSLGAAAQERFRAEASTRETILREAHDQLRLALARAENAVHMRSRLVANVSHELRTPINVIVGYTDILLEATDDDATIRDTAPRIRDCAVSLEALVSDLLDLSRLTCAKTELTIQEISVPAMLDEVAAGTRRLLRDKPVEVVVQCSVGTCRSDRMRLLQILNNLAGNAAKFTRRGRITIRAQQERDWISFQVSDTGCGIPPSAQERIFTAFEQLKTGHEGGGGIGLGLAIVRQLTDLLNGTVTVQSVPGGGSTFTLTVPSSAVATAA